MTIWRGWVLSCVALMALSINSDRAKGSVDFPCEAQNSQRVPYVYNFDVGCTHCPNAYAA